MPAPRYPYGVAIRVACSPDSGGAVAYCVCGLAIACIYLSRSESLVLVLCCI